MNIRHSTAASPLRAMELMCWPVAGIGLFFLRITSRTSFKKRGARQWLTEEQTAQRYNSATVAREIIEAKLADESIRATQVRHHPDPGT